MPKREEERQEGLKRLAFEELFYYSLFLEKEERDFLSLSGNEEKIPGKREEFQKGLPFSLTKAQSEALEEMDRVFSQGERLLRFVQGDVGSDYPQNTAFFKSLINSILLLLTAAANQ